ncbi:hypothetical protein [Burkholderia phage BCSR5]|nr:hypothetical protein [Burkholderia phage BCSR5]
MGRSSLFDVMSLPDPAQSWNFDLFLPNIPGSSDTRDLTFKCMTTDLPGFGLDVVETPLHGVTLNFAGRAIYTHTMNAVFLETADWGTRQKFRTWREMARSWKNNSGSFASSYKVTAEFVLYNDIPQVVRTCRLYGLWPETVAEFNMDGGASNIVQQTVTFRYDWVDDL